MPYDILAWMSGLGALGGFVNCLINGEIKFQFYNRETKVFSAGFLGNIVAGAVAAVVIGCIYGPLSNIDLTQAHELHITLAQLISSLVVGFSGGRILSLEAQKITLTTEKNQEKDAKINLAEGVASFSDDIGLTEDASTTDEEENK